MLTAVLRENGVAMTEPQMDMMVANTFLEHDVSCFFFPFFACVFSCRSVAQSAPPPLPSAPFGFRPHASLPPSPPFALLQTNGDGFIDYEEYKQMCAVNQSILKPLTINVGEIIRDAKADAAAAGAANAGPGGGTPHGK
jgi:hypothetical protein